MSKACIGCPYSSIIKLVKSTILFIGRRPDFISLSFIQNGDSPMFIAFIDTPEYLLQLVSLIFTLKSFLLLDILRF